MRVIKLPMDKVSPTQGLVAIMDRAKTAIQKYCTDKVIELKLVPKTFTYVFNFWESRRVASKAVDRLCSIVSKAAVKQVPLINHTEVPFFEKWSGRGLAITLTAPETKCDTSLGGESRGLLGTTVETNNVRYWKTVHRYIRYLNYLSKKYALPVSLKAENIPTYDRDQDDSVRATGNREEIAAFVPTYTPQLIIRAQLALSVPRGGAAMSNESLDEVIRRSSQLHLPDNLTGDALLSAFCMHESGWATHPLRDYAGNRIPHTTSLELVKYYIPERLFYFIPQCMKSLQTLSRKANYAHTAFSIGSPNSSAD